MEALSSGATSGGAYRPSSRASGRSSSRIRDIQAFLNEVKEDNLDRGAITYIDIGCSEGQITEAVAGYMGLTPKTAYGVDVVDQPSGPSFTFGQTNGTVLDFPDDAFALETMFMSMHHFQEPVKMLAESRRVAKTGATLIIREHDMSQPYLALWYNLAHAMYSVVFNAEETPEDFADKIATGTYAYYRPRGEWESMLADAGWKMQAYAETGKQGRGDSMNAFYAMYLAV
jgi:SAM-dependent methyltransferase